MCYVYFEEFQTVLLVVDYAKSRKDDLDEDEKEVCKRAIERARKSLTSRFYK